MITLTVNLDQGPVLRVDETDEVLIKKDTNSLNVAKSLCEQAIAVIDGYLQKEAVSL
jgi:hypothetical protein